MAEITDIPSGSMEVQERSQFTIVTVLRFDAKKLRAELYRRIVSDHDGCVSPAKSIGLRTLSAEEAQIRNIHQDRIFLVTYSPIPIHGRELSLDLIMAKVDAIEEDITRALRNAALMEIIKGDS